MPTHEADRPSRSSTLPPHPSHSVDDDVVLFDTERLRQLAGRTGRACRRYPGATAAGVIAVLGVGCVSWLAAPYSYMTSGVVAARADVVSPAIANPSRSVPDRADQPLANAPEIVLSEDNLNRIIDEVGLLDRRHAGETALGRFRRHAFEAIGMGTDETKLRDALRRDLHQAMSVQIDGGSNGPDRITISVMWPDADDAMAIVSAAQENFLDARRVADLGPIEDAAAILERHGAEADAKVATLREQLDFPLTDSRDIPDGSPLRVALDRQADLADRLAAANIELEAAEAAFQYRYTVVSTPDEPPGPLTAIIKRFGITMLLGMASGCGLALLRDGRARRRAANASADSAATAVVAAEVETTEALEATETSDPAEADVDDLIELVEAPVTTEAADEAEAPDEADPETLVAVPAGTNGVASGDKPRDDRASVSRRQSLTPARRLGRNGHAPKTPR